MRKAFIAAALSLACSPSLATELSAPTGKPVLTITGAITNTNAGGTAVFDDGMLDALPGRETIATTPWYDHAETFKGPLASALLDAVGATGTTVRVTAINDYFADIPISDFKKDPVIFATSIDGKKLSVRDKGPIFVIYPFNENPALYNEAYFGKSVWQVTKIDVR